MPDPATCELIDSVAVLTMDDGKANGFGLDMIAALQACLDRAVKGAGAVVLTGREGILSGGFDLKVIRAGDPQVVSSMRWRRRERCAT
jgi:enoyl-CoA hydratase